MSKPLLLFDVDGTLIKTGGAGMRAMHHVVRQLFGQGFTLKGIQVSGHLDPLIFAEAAAMNGLSNDPLHHKAFRDHYLVQLEANLEAAGKEVRTLQGINETLAILRKRTDVVLGLLTGNYTRAVPIKLRAVGIDMEWFSVTAFGDEAASRAGLVALAMDKYQSIYGQRVKNQWVVVIGDTPRDVACAKAHGCVSFAVATGSYRIDDLRKAGADVVVKDLSDSNPLIDLIDSFQD